MHNTPFYTQQWCNEDYLEWCDMNADTTPEDETIVCACDNCDDEIYDSDEMTVVEERLCTGETKIRHICSACWEENHWDRSTELLDMLGIWYWTGNAADAMKHGNSQYLEGQRRYKRMLGTAVEMSLAAVSRKENA